MENEIPNADPRAVQDARAIAGPPWLARGGAAGGRPAAHAAQTPRCIGRGIAE